MLSTAAAPFEKLFQKFIHSLTKALREAAPAFDAEKELERSLYPRAQALYDYVAAGGKNTASRTSLSDVAFLRNDFLKALQNAAGGYYDRVRPNEAGPLLRELFLTDIQALGLNFTASLERSGQVANLQAFLAGIYSF